MSNHSLSAKMADENTTEFQYDEATAQLIFCDDAVDSVKGKTFKNYLNQKRKDASIGKDTASAVVKETVNLNQVFPGGRAFLHQNPLVLIEQQDRASVYPWPS